MSKCLVKDCNLFCSRFILPTREDLKLIWLERSGNKFKDLTTKKQWRICPLHFQKECFVKLDEKGEGKLLKKFALPSLALPNYSLKGDISDNFSFPVNKEIGPERFHDIVMPSSSSVNYSPVGKVKTPTRVYGGKITKINALPSTSTHHVEVIPSTSTSGIGIEPLPTPPKVQSYFKKSQPQIRADFHKTVGWLKNLQRKKNVNIQNLVGMITEREELMNTLSKYSEASLNLFACNLRNLHVKRQGRRFSQEDKMFALSLYKQSPRAYRFLSKFFSLPSRKSLDRLLNAVSFLPGVNKNVMQHLKARVDKLAKEDRYCVVMFDEMSLQPRLKYNQKTHCVDGFVDLGDGKRRLQIADHALVFMAKGIRKPWKQPVIFGFCEGTTPTVDLVHCIQTIIGELQAIGLNVIATVSDQGATNQAAVNQLVGPNRIGPLIYGVGDEEIVHLYDAPHLLKGLRNGLLVKDLLYSMNGSEKVARWSHILRLYEIDQMQGPYKQCTRLTDEHVLPKKIRKMKVKLASQVFSNTVASAMYTRVRNVIDYDVQPSSSNYISPQAQDTVELLLFFDKLFDSVNGQVRYPPPGKPLLGAVTRDSEHESFWLSAISILNSMSFISERPIRANYPSIKNWISTLHGFCYLRETLLPIMEYFFPRRFNQDPLENWFSQIRSHGSGNSNCSSFITSFKSLLISSFSSSHSVGANCEEDLSAGLLGLKIFVKEQEHFQYPEVEGDISLSSVPEALCLDFATDYVAGAVIKQFLSKFPCNSCEELLRSSEELPEHLQARQYEGHLLVNPEEVFTFVFKQVTFSILEIISSIIHKYGVKEIILSELKKKNYTFLLCDEHKEDRQDHLLNIIINIVFFNYIKEVNRVLKGIDMRMVNRGGLFQMAHNKYLKSRKRPERGLL